MSPFWCVYLLQDLISFFMIFQKLKKRDKTWASKLKKNPIIIGYLEVEGQKM